MNEPRQEELTLLRKLADILEARLLADAVYSRYITIKSLILDIEGRDPPQVARRSTEPSDIPEREEIVQSDRESPEPSRAVTKRIALPTRMRHPAPVETEKLSYTGKWPEDQVAALIGLKGQGLDHAEIAEKLGRRKGQIGQMVQQLKAKGLLKETAPSEDWPEPVRPPKTQPRMRFKTVKAKNSWGHESDMQVPIPLGKRKDPDTGKDVTVYPTGYAYGAHEQKNVHVKGGA